MFGLFDFVFLAGVGLIVLFLYRRERRARKQWQQRHEWDYLNNRSDEDKERGGGREQI